MCTSLGLAQALYILYRSYTSSQLLYCPSTTYFLALSLYCSSVPRTDTGATDHMIPDRSAFISYRLVSGRQVKMGNGYWISHNLHKLNGK